MAGCSGDWQNLPSDWFSNTDWRELIRFLKRFGQILVAAFCDSQGNCVE